MVWPTTLNISELANWLFVWLLAWLIYWLIWWLIDLPFDWLHSCLDWLTVSTCWFLLRLPQVKFEQLAFTLTLQDSVRFASQMQKAIKVLCQLLGSKVSTDILETIDFFISANEFNLSDIEEDTRKMLALIWSRDAAVREAVVNAYRKLYIEPREESDK